MKITVHRIKKLTSGKMKAFVDIVLDGTVVIKGCKVFEGPTGLFAALPSQKSAKDDKWYPTVEISDSILRDEFNRVCLEAYGPLEASSLGPSVAEQEAMASGDQVTPF